MRQIVLKQIVLATVAVLLFAVPVVAQTPEPAVPGKELAPRLGPKACRDRDRLQRGDTVETDGSAPRQDETPGDRLARTEGVICPPPELDPDIRAPAPPAGGSNMPVIPPPGSPGGDPGMRPK